MASASNRTPFVEVKMPGGKGSGFVSDVFGPGVSVIVWRAYV